MDSRAGPGYNMPMKATDVILYTDMDGTALTDWSLGPVVPARNLAAIRAFLAAGGLFSVASGRQAPAILQLFPGVAFQAPLVCGNGAVIYDPRASQVVQRICLPPCYKQASVDYFLSHQGVCLVAADEERILQVVCGDPARDDQLNDWPRPRLTIPEFLSRDFVKVVYVLGEGGDMDALKGEVAGLPGAELVTGAQSGPLYLEMVERTVDKGTGIRRALAAAGLEGRTLVCIGDYFNDEAMLRQADIAACPANAAQGIREMCQIVTCCNNEGALADLLEQLGLI